MTLRRSTPKDDKGRSVGGSAAPSRRIGEAAPALRSKVTSKGQTTLPSGLRRALGIRSGKDELEYVIQDNHAVVRRAASGDAIGEDPALLGLLDLIERDIERNAADRLTSIPRALFDRIRKVVAGVEVDLEDRIDGPIAL